jgi:hypothetical protein
MDPQVAQHAHHLIRHFLVFALIAYLVGAVVYIIPLLQTARKAGLHYTIGLLPLIPGLGVLIATYIVAFSEWKSPRV